MQMAETANFKDQIIILLSFCTAPECSAVQVPSSPWQNPQFANGNMSGCTIKHF